jgi:hypothetical protein
MFRATTFTTHGRVLTKALVSLLLIGILAACGESTQGNSSATPTAKPPIPSVTITAKDFSFDMPETLSAGLVDITMTNAGAEAHQAQLARLNQGVTTDQILAAVKGDPATLLPLLTLVGGPNGIDPGQSQEVIVNLSSGQHVALCFFSGADNVPHAAKGMVKFFQVHDPSNVGQVSEPTAQGEVTLKDFSITMPSTLKPEPILLKVVNQGPQPHEVGFVKLAPGKSLQDVTNFLHNPTGPPPFEKSAGGMGALAPNTSGWMKLNLAAGNYVALCFVPDPATKKSHAELGMITAFTVQ